VIQVKCMCSVSDRKIKRERRTKQSKKCVTANHLERESQEGGVVRSRNATRQRPMKERKDKQSSVTELKLLT
jgi:hypothetical protein